LRIRRALIDKYKGHFGDALIILTSSLLSKVLVLLTLMGVSRLVGSIDFGKYQTLLFTLMLFASSVQSSLNLYANKYVASHGGGATTSLFVLLRSVYVAALVAGALSFLVTYSLSSWIATEWLSDESLNNLIKIGSLTLLIGPLGAVQTGVLAGASKFRQSAALSSLPPIVAAPFYIGFSWGYGVEGAAWAMVLQGVIGSAWGFVLVRKAGFEFRRLLVARTTLCEYRRMARYCFPTFLSGFVVAPANWYSTVLLVAVPGGYIEMAAYGVANQWKQAILFIPTALSSYVTSHLSRSAADVERHKKLFLASAFVALVSGLVVAVIVSLFSKELIDAYRIDLNDAWLVLTVSSFAAAIIAVNNMYSRAAASVGRTWRFLSYEVVWGGVFIVATALLVEEHKALGVAIAGLVAACAQLLVQIAISRFGDRTIIL